jgi:hypothetical protein
MASRSRKDRTNHVQLVARMKPATTRGTMTCAGGAPLQGVVERALDTDVGAEQTNSDEARLLQAFDSRQALLSLLLDRFPDVPR